jgi:hypothetical protein
MRRDEQQVKKCMVIIPDSGFDHGSGVIRRIFKATMFAAQHGLHVLLAERLIKRGSLSDGLYSFQGKMEQFCFLSIPLIHVASLANERCAHDGLD